MSPRAKLRPGSPTLAVAYIRVSTEDQNLGPAAQLAALERWCLANGVRLVQVLEDIGVSGAAELDKRPGLLKALDVLKASGAGVLLVAKRDRLARDVLLAAMIERLVERQGARIMAADGTGNGDDPESQLMRNLVAAFAMYERAIIRARTKAALGVKKARGERTGSVPYGFALSPDGVHLEVDPVEARAVDLARRLRAEGLSLRAIGTRLLEQSHVPRGGRTWNPNTVARICASA